MGQHPGTLHSRVTNVNNMATSIGGNGTRELIKIIGGALNLPLVSYLPIEEASIHMK